jgi:4-hydroxybenzoate polyprenyltransferase
MERKGVLNYIIQVGGFIRWPNLVMIVLTMFLVRYSVILLVFNNNQFMLSPMPDFILLVIATLLVTVGGYIINDYFDVPIDRVNRPDKVMIYRLISPRWAIKLHILLNGIAVILGFYLGWRIKSMSFGFIFPFVAGLLWSYSAKYKRILFWGNFIVAILSSFLVLIVWLFEFFWLHLSPGYFASIIPMFNTLTSIITGYAVFAFLMTFIREVVKDMEDSEGDKKFDCRTIPVVLGWPKTRLLLTGIVAVMMILLAYVQVILFRIELMMAFYYFLFAVQIPAIYLSIQLYRARVKSDYQAISLLCKLVMVAGILSMEILLISN